MTKTLIALAAAAAMTVAAVGTPTTAEARSGGAIAAGVIGGLAAGAIIGSAANGGYYNNGYNNGYYAYSPAPVYGPRCYITRQKVWTNFGPRWQRVRVCD